MSRWRARTPRITHELVGASCSAWGIRMAPSSDLKEGMIFVGMDLGKRRHAACFLDGNGRLATLPGPNQVVMEASGTMSPWSRFNREELVVILVLASILFVVLVDVAAEVLLSSSVQQILLTDVAIAAVGVVAIGVLYRTELLPKPKRLHLTRREREVLELVVEGLTHREIAERLVVSERTVETQVRTLRLKFGAKSRAELVELGARHLGRGHTP